jgi:hypothetical protein
MPCADEQVISKVKDVLEAEPINQVGSFVWTHLTNLMESSSPHKQSIANIIDNADLKVCYPPSDWLLTCYVIFNWLLVV